jgi:septal ring factor EnvC (AmiA/AmiB activator)
VRAELAAVRAAREKLEQPTAKAASDPKKGAGTDAEGLRNSLQQERDRSKRIESELAAARHDVETQAASAGKASDELSRLKQTAESAAAELNGSLQQERKRVENLTQDLAAARRDVAKQAAMAARASDDATRLKQAAEDTAAGLQRDLQQEHDRTQALTQDLAAARRDLEANTALANKANAEIVRQKQAAESDSAKLKQSLQQEHDRAEALAESLSMARAAIYAAEARTRALSDQPATGPKQAAQADRMELRKSLQEARDRIAALEHDLADARRDTATQAAIKTKAVAESERLKQLVEQSAAERTRLMRQKPERPGRPEAALALARSVKDEPVLVPVARRTSDKSTDTPAKPAAGQAAPGARNPGDATEVARLVARASVLLGQGNIGATRIVLERAAEMGSAEASFALAETYDPRILPKWGAYGTRGDTAKARDLYARAGAAGIKGTKERIDALPR